MKQPVVTLAVPVYNGAATLKKCVDSLIAEGAEIIIVNDGSTDNTLEIAKSYGDAVCIINKENGGHGSGINAAIKMATGKYFKVIDADDWAINLGEYIEKLKVRDSDIVITHFHTINAETGFVDEYKTTKVEFEREYTIEEYWKCGITRTFQFHGVTFRTELYRKKGIELPERVYFEDQYYAVMPFKYAESVAALDLFVYEYSIGNINQSVSDQNRAKRIGDMEKVFWLTYKELADSGKARPYFIHKLNGMLLSMYSAALLKDSDKTRGRTWRKQFRKRLKEGAREFYKSSAVEYIIIAIWSRIGVTPQLLYKLRNNRVYKKTRRRIEMYSEGAE